MFLFFMIILLTLLKVLRWWNVIFWSNSTWLMRQRRMDQCLITVDPQIDPKEVIKSHKIRTHLKIIQLLQEYCASFYHKYFYSFRIFLCCLHTIVLHTHHKNASTEYISKSYKYNTTIKTTFPTIPLAAGGITSFPIVFKSTALRRGKRL